MRGMGRLVSCQPKMLRSGREWEATSPVIQISSIDDGNKNKKDAQEHVLESSHKISPNPNQVIIDGYEELKAHVINLTKYIASQDRSVSGNIISPGQTDIIV